MPTRIAKHRLQRIRKPSKLRAFLPNALAHREQGLRIHFLAVRPSKRHPAVDDPNELQILVVPQPFIRASAFEERRDVEPAKLARFKLQQQKAASFGNDLNQIGLLLFITIPRSSSSTGYHMLPPPIAKDRSEMRQAPRS